MIEINFEKDSQEDSTTKLCNAGFTELVCKNDNTVLTFQYKNTKIVVYKSDFYNNKAQATLVSDKYSNFIFGIYPELTIKDTELKEAIDTNLKRAANTKNLKNVSKFQNGMIISYVEGTLREHGIDVVETHEDGMNLIFNLNEELYLHVTFKSLKEKETVDYENMLICLRHRSYSWPKYSICKFCDFVENKISKLKLTLDESKTKYLEIAEIQNNIQLIQIEINKLHSEKYNKVIQKDEIIKNMLR